MAIYVCCYSLQVTAKDTDYPGLEAYFLTQRKERHTTMEKMASEKMDDIIGT
jgi:hypothetical protein